MSQKNFAKIVQWSDEDNCFIGTCPEAFKGGVHGSDEHDVYRRLCLAVKDVCGPARSTRRARSTKRRVSPQRHAS